MTRFLCLVVFGFYVFLSHSVLAGANSPNNNHEGLSTSSPPESCKGCHEQIYQDWKTSFHSKSTTSPAFRGMFTIFDFSTQGKSPEECFNCHATESKTTKNYEALRQAVLNDEPNTPGITCAACHGITEVNDVPDLLVPITLHSVNLPAHNVEKGVLFKKAVMCSACHDYNNAHAVQGKWQDGVPCCDTNRDFRRTNMAKRGVTCQSCHMNAAVNDDANAWKDELSRSNGLKYSLGRLLNLDRYIEKKTWKGHRFPGSHDEPMLKSAFDIEMNASRSADSVSVNLAIENLTGHSIPNGCPPRTRIFLRVWLEDADGFEVDSEQIEYGFNFKDKNGNEPAMVDTAVARGFDYVFEAETTDEQQFVLSLEDTENEDMLELKASLTYVHFVMPPSEAQNRMQQGLIKRIQSGTQAEKDYILNTEIPGRMAAMNALSSAYKPIVFWQARATVSDSGISPVEVKE